MCLELPKNAKAVKARKDIICYKSVYVYFKSTTIDLDSLQHGQEFYGWIDGVLCSGHISKRGSDVFYCTDEEELDGSICEEKFGHKYSWMHNCAIGLITDSANKMPVADTFHTPYRRTIVKIGETYKSMLNVRPSAFNDVVEAGLHTYEDEDGAFYERGNVVIECVIPKGSIYYRGIYFGKSSYASDTLHYKRLLYLKFEKQKETEKV